MGDNLIISVELIDGTDNSQIWGNQYNRRLADLFTVQQELAKDISSKLRLKLSRTEQQQLENHRQPTYRLFNITRRVVRMFTEIREKISRQRFNIFNGLSMKTQGMR